MLRIVETAHASQSTFSGYFALLDGAFSRRSKDAPVATSPLKRFLRDNPSRTIVETVQSA
jgi:hypothetical protein